MGLVSRIRAGSAVVGILGLGYVGLPLAEVFSRKGFKVIGLDTDAQKVSSLAGGHTYIRHIPDEVISRLLATGFEPSSDFSRVAECDVLLICVPTPLNQNLEPDMSFVVGSCRQIAPYLKPDQQIGRAHV